MATIAWENWRARFHRAMDNCVQDADERLGALLRHRRVCPDDEPLEPVDRRLVDSGEEIMLVT